MDACILSAAQDPVEDTHIPIKGRYKLADKVTSKEIRAELEQQLENFDYKLPTARDHVEQVLPKINKLTCVKAKSLALRLIHGDIFTGEKMFRFGMQQDDECLKCRET